MLYHHLYGIHRFETISRLNIVSPKDNERFFLKLLLNHVKGVTSFKDIRTFNNITYDTGENPMSGEFESRGIRYVTTAASAAYRTFLS